MTDTIVRHDPGPRPELTWLPVDRLDVDEAYQRSLDTAGGKRLIARIAANFRWSAFQAILAAPNSPDRWSIIDGQHRVAAARRVNIALVPAVVIHDADAASQAAAFVGANHNRVAVPAQALFHARVAAGDADAATVARLCANAGIEILRYQVGGSKFPAWKTSAVQALLYIHKTYGEPIAREAIAAVAHCYGDQPGALRAGFFRVAARFLNEGGTSLDLRAALTSLGWRKLDAVQYGLTFNTALPDMLQALREALDGNLSQKPPAPIIPPAPQPPAGQMTQAQGFQDDPRAKSDRGSSAPLNREAVFGRSAAGSSLA